MERAINSKTHLIRIREVLKVPDISRPLRWFIAQNDLRRKAGELGRMIEFLEPEKVRPFAEEIEQHNPDRNPKFGALLVEVKEALFLVADAVETMQEGEAIGLLQKLGEVMQATEPEAEAADDK
jgi:hypothetical protein